MFKNSLKQLKRMNYRRQHKNRHIVDKRLLPCDIESIKRRQEGRAPSLKFEREDGYDYLIARSYAREKRRREAAIAAAEQNPTTELRDSMFVVLVNDDCPPERTRYDDYDDTASATVNGQPLVESLPNGMQQRNGLSYGRVRAWHREMQQRRTDDLRAL